MIASQRSPGVRSAEKRTFEYEGWRFSESSGGILSAGELDEWKMLLSECAREGQPRGDSTDRDKEADAGSASSTPILQMPEAVFGSNALEICHVSSGTTITFEPLEALKGALLKGPSTEYRPRDKRRPEVPRVSYASQWRQSEATAVSASGTEVEKITALSDWTFTTSYFGAVTRPSRDTSASSSSSPETCSPSAFTRSTPMPMHRLLRRYAILFSVCVPLFHSDLDDNGLSKLEVKLRVMPDFWYALVSFELRVDKVLIRSIETRYFHSFTDEDYPSNVRPTISGSQSNVAPDGTATACLSNVRNGTVVGSPDCRNHTSIWRDFTFKEANWEALSEAHRGNDLGPGNLSCTHECVGTELLTDEDIKHHVSEAIPLARSSTLTSGTPSDSQG